MQKSKLCALSALASLVLGFAAPALAQEQQYLPDVENLVGEAVALGAHLSWDSVTGADMYTVYYGTASVQDDGGLYSSDKIVENATEYTITELTPGTTYYFAVAAEDSTGQYLGSYSYSNEVAVIPLPQGAQAAPATEATTTPITTTSPDTATTTPENTTTTVIPGEVIPESTAASTPTETPIDLHPVVENNALTTVPTTTASNQTAGLEECEFGICPQPQAAVQEQLPQSGPGLALLFGMSGVSALLLRRKKKQ